VLERIPRRPSRQQQAEGTLCARDRLLAVLETSPRLSQQDADLINRVVQEAREASIADELSA
jgi:hypothetical protein